MRKVVGSNLDDDLYNRIASFSFAIDLKKRRLLRDHKKIGTAIELRDRKKLGLLETTFFECEMQGVVRINFLRIGIGIGIGAIYHGFEELPST